MKKMKIEDHHNFTIDLKLLALTSAAKNMMLH